MLFWKGFLSQWYMSTFTKDGIEYVCAEQWMMAEKARLFGDEETLELILADPKPRNQKNLGRMVRGFDEETWKSHRSGIVEEGSYLKFSQNDELKEALLATGDLELVEASPYDKIWGIGLKPDDRRARSKSNWKGMNLLGKALMVARDRIREEE